MNESKINENYYPKRPKKQIKKLRDENIFIRYPKATFWTGLTVSLLIFFSRPLYEIFIGPAFELTEGELRAHKRQVRMSSIALDRLMGYSEEEIEAHYKKLDEEEARKKSQNQKSA